MTVPGAGSRAKPEMMGSRPVLLAAIRARALRSARRLALSTSGLAVKPRAVQLVSLVSFLLAGASTGYVAADSAVTGASVGGAAAASQPAALQPMPPLPSPHQLPRSELFTFHSDVFLNLHHFLYRWAQAGPGADTSSLDRRIRLRDEDRQVHAALSSAERAQWDKAIGYYRLGMIERDLLFDDEMVALRDCLVMAGNFCDRIAERDQDTLDLLNETMPVFRRHWWERHNDENRAWINVQIPLARAHEAQIAARVAAAYTGTWPESRNRVDVMVYANRVGGYTTSDGHITVTSIEAGTQDYLGLELLFHEASHGDTMERPLRRLIRDSFDAIGAEVPRDLWHMTIFYTAGEITRAVLAEAGIDYPQTYAEFAGIFSRREDNIRAKAALDTAWKDALVGQGGFEEAMRRVAEAWRAAER